MTNLLKIFFTIPVNDLKRKGGVLTQEHKGDLIIDAVLTDDNKIQFNSIEWNGVNLFPLLSCMPEAKPTLDALIEAAKHHVDTLDPIEKFQLIRYGNIIESHQMNYQSRLIAFMAWEKTQTNSITENHLV